MTPFVAEPAEFRLSEALAGKVNSVEQHLRSLGTVLVAFSGGVDSSLLLALAVSTLGREYVVAVTATGVVASDEDTYWAERVATEVGVEVVWVELPYLDIPGFADNSPDRCYLCKQQLYLMLEAMRVGRGLDAIVDGAITTDADDYRPGQQAAVEAGVISPLAEAGFGKDEVRVVCRAFGLSVAERPASPCLASRFPYGERITEEALNMVRQAEAALRALGLSVVRVRHHKRLARIEVPPGELGRLVAEPTRAEVVRRLRVLGYGDVMADLRGFRSGSLNEALESHAALAARGAPAIIRSPDVGD